MKAVTSLAVCLAVLSPLASAWPKWLPDIDALVVRQNDKSTTAAPSVTPTPTGSKSASATGSGAKFTNLNTAKAPNGTETGAGSKATHTEFDPVDAVGGISMVTPAPTAGGVNLYKIGDYVTWGWNYTDLQATPTAIDILISCSRASETWTLTSNMTWETAGSFTWDSKVQATAVESPLLTEQYTLLIYDADAGIKATPAAGYLALFSQFSFGMYTPQPYTPLAEWNCATCSAAMSALDTKAVGFAITMSVITFASFTWFVTGLGMF